MSTSFQSSSRDEIRLLAVGDVHLGTRPSRLPDELESAGIDRRELTPESALARVVDLAVDEAVDAVLFAGDVVDSANARYEALRPLEEAVRRLHHAKIPVLAVVGNHDVEALPRLSKMIEGLELVGERGCWEARVVENAAGARVEVLGWSFPERHVRESPVARLLRDPIPPSESGVPRLGLLHGDLDASGGTYAPVSSAEFAAAGLDAWLLGHIHKPSLPEADPGRAESGPLAPQGYLGSLVGLDPGEAGPRGPWLIRVTADGRVLPRHLPLAPLRWERFDVRVREGEGPEDVGDRIVAEATHFTQRLQATGCVPRVLGLRPRLVGAMRDGESLRRQIDGAAWKGSLTRTVGETFFFVERVIDALEPALDLEDLARGDDPPAVLAREILILERGGEERAELIALARDHLKPFAEDARWADLAEPGRRDHVDPLSDDALADVLLRSGRAALTRLLDQIPDPLHGQGERTDGGAERAR